MGKKADFVILDKNPLKTEAEELAHIQVLMTLKENEVVYRNISEGETSHE